MHEEGIKGFPYYVGVDSLGEIATKKDRVCVLNIVGGESRAVTPISHIYSGGNIVFGTSPGRSGQKLKTAIGDIPVYNSVKEGLAAGHKFNTAVIYLPPSGVRDGVAEVVRKNPDLKKVIILTEKISVRDSRVIRAICQTNGVDVFGGNCLGVADSWNHVRIGGALGGNAPEESLLKGTVALFSNSGNFTTTIAVYLGTEGWGTTTSISSGKDVYIQYGPEEFTHAFHNDDRSKAAVMYAEPGGYYEHGLKFDKPVVACVVGRWKAKLTKACGHAGSLAGTGDNAIAKEQWFMDAFDCDDIYTPEKPVFTKKGAVVTNIAHIPEALTKVMEANGLKPDFEPTGDLSLKCWMGNSQGLKLPKELDVPVVEAMAPYNEQIEAIDKQVGVQFPRQAMKDTSGASMMDPKTQVTKVHKVSILDCSKKNLEENLVFSLMKEYPEDRATKLANLAFNSYVNMDGDVALAAADASREAENSPNTVLSSAISIIGRGRAKKAIATIDLMTELFHHDKVEDPFAGDGAAKAGSLSADQKAVLTDGEDGSKFLERAKALGGDSMFIQCLDAATGGKPSQDAVLGAIWATVGWNGLMRKKISKLTMGELPWYSLVFSAFVGSSVVASKHTADSFCGVKNDEIIDTYSFTETAFLALIGKKPVEAELFEFSVLLGLIISNGPGTISAQGTKGAVSADGPQDPLRVQINKAFVGMLTHTGFAHGGNGYEAVAFLIDLFKSSGLKDPSDKGHGIDLKTLATKYCKDYADYKKKEKAAGNIDYAKVPCINHPVFKGKDVNYDPREQFVSGLFEEKGIYNIFLDFYHNIVQSMFDTKVTKNVYCVNVDAVIAVILLKMVWGLYNDGKISDSEVESAGFTTFLFGRMIGTAIEADDHQNRGRNMDTRTAASKVSYVG